MRLLTISALALAGAAMIATPALGAANQVSICHATGSATNPYVLIHPAAAGVANGHYGHQDARDVIPPFTYKGVGYSRTGMRTARRCSPTAAGRSPTRPVVAAEAAGPSRAVPRPSRRERREGRGRYARPRTTAKKPITASTITMMTRMVQSMWFLPLRTADEASVPGGAPPEPPAGDQGRRVHCGSPRDRR